MFQIKQKVMFTFLITICHLKHSFHSSKHYFIDQTNRPFKIKGQLFNSGFIEIQPFQPYSLLLFLFNMSQTIKDKVKTQIQIHQQLVNYYDSDSDSFQEAQVKLSDLPRPTLGNDIESDDSDSGQHEKMNQRRKKILGNLQYSSKQNIYPQQKKQQRPLKPGKPHQAPSQEQNKQIVQLKAKIAQLLKQSQQKSSKITDLETQVTLMTIKVENLKQEIQQNQVNLNSTSEKIASLTLQNKNLSQNYQNSLKEYEKEYKKRTECLHNEVIQINQSTVEKDKKIDLLASLINLKDQELQQLKKNDQKAQKCIAQNSKLKSDLNRLITLLQTTVKGENLSKSSKNVLEEKLSSFKPKKERSKSFAFNNIFLQSKKIKTSKHISSCFDAHYASLPSKGSKHEISQLDWFPNDLINQVESFLKKWRMSQNNKKFVNGLVSFIDTYTEKCVNQAKSKMENQYKSLKKEIQRKANQSLVLGEIIKERQLKIKLNKSQNKDIIAKSPLKGDQTKIENLNLTSQNVSILVPASNKKFKESRKNNFLCGSLLQKTQKDDIGYTNLEKSMKIHRQNSAQAFYPQFQMSGKIIDSFILQKLSGLKDKSKNFKTESSVKSSKKQSINSSSKKRSVKSVSHKKSFDFPLRKFNII